MRAKQLAFGFITEERIKQAHQAIWDGVMEITALALLIDDHPDHARLVKNSMASIDAVVEYVQEMYLKLHKMCETLYGCNEPWKFVLENTR